MAGLRDDASAVELSEIDNLSSTNAMAALRNGVRMSVLKSGYFM